MEKREKSILIIKGELAYEVLWLLFYDCLVPQELIESAIKNPQVIVDSEKNLLAFRKEDANTHNHECFDTGGWKILNISRMPQPVFQQVIIHIIEDQYPMIRN